MKSGTIVSSSSFNTSQRFSFTPNTSGSYTVKVYVKDALSNSPYDSIREFTITISSKPLYLSKLPLYYGMKNSDVIALDNALIKLGYLNTSVSRSFDTATKNAVVAFQKTNGLTADGIVGSITYNKLNERLIEKSGIKTLLY